jgi:hypothetical protein
MFGTKISRRMREEEDEGQENNKDQYARRSSMVA